MSGVASKPGSRTIADWLALPTDHRYELIDGELVEKAVPTFEHGLAQSHTVAAVDGAYGRRLGGPGGPGGWWIVTEVDILLDGRGFGPDIAGWRRERAEEPPKKERPVSLRPDWICEIVSDSNRAIDTVTKLRRYHQASVPHYWILDHVDRTLTVHRHTSEGYLVAMRAEVCERVRAEPFAEIELYVAFLLGDDE